MDDLRREQVPGVDQPTADSAEMLGGDPVCWAHLFDDQTDEVELITAAPTPFELLNAAHSELGDVFTFDAAAIAREARRSGPMSSRRSADLDINILVFGAGEGIADHVNTAVDVLIVAISGEGELRLDGQTITLKSGQLALLPKGTRRGIRAVSDRFAYVSCHRRRSGLFPTPKQEG